MGYIYCLMGKSSSGKDTIYKELMADPRLQVKRVVPYTTRPIRDGEIPGKSYYFCTEEEVAEMEKTGKIIELREYQTVYGPWKYFTANDGQIDLDGGDYLVIGTLEAYVQFKKYFGEEIVVPIYIEVEDGERLLRAIAREKMQEVPKYEEMCRRFLSDQKDFAEEKLKEAGVSRRFQNHTLEQILAEITSYIIEKNAAKQSITGA